MKPLSLNRTVLAVYVMVLLWLVLFKFSSDPLSVISNYHIRSLNLIPFADTSRPNFYQIVYNIVTFIPLGVLLGINLKHTDFWRKLTYIFIFSVSVELVQFIFAIGRTDITDVITNTFGGLLGLGLYKIGKSYIDSEKLDRFISVTALILIILFLLLRTFVFRVRYKTH